MRSLVYNIVMRSPSYGIVPDRPSSQNRRGIFHSDCEEYFTTVEFKDGKPLCGYCRGQITQEKLAEFSKRFGHPER